MAKSNLNVVMQGASGKIGKTLVFRQSKTGETNIANRAMPRTGAATTKEVAVREKFLNATYTAKRLQHDPVHGPQYLAKATKGKSAYLMAMGDCLNPPKIKGIFLEGYTGAIGSEITVRAMLLLRKRA